MRRRLGRFLRVLLVGVIGWGVLVGSVAGVLIHRDQAAAAARAPLPALHVRLLRRDVWAYHHFPAYRTPIPVLGYHGIGSQRNYLTVTRKLFSQQMAALHLGGFHTISIATYARYLEGKAVKLPSRPILLTFDDGRIDSYRGADRVLARYHYQASMFVVAAWVSEHPGFALHWDELAAMQGSGRWSIQEHAGREHTRYRTDAKGDLGEAYAYRRWIPGSNGGGQKESFAAYKRRVTGDIAWGEAQLRAHIPGYRPYAFAVPYSNYGQRRTNDPRIPRFFLAMLHRHFPVVFDGDYLDEGASRPQEPKGRTPPGLSYRITMGPQVGAATLDCRLYDFTAVLAMWREYSCIQPGPIGEAPRDSED
jgi:peptidoglycan/xylan/chitin deacetylase (PgdA/CDA1 family)